VPVSRFDFRKPKPGDLTKMIEQARQYREDVADTPYIRALRDVQKRSELLATEPAGLGVRDVRLLVDDPAKVREDKGADGSRVLEGLERAIGSGQREALIISPYWSRTSNVACGSRC
jgi:hypothetical protein